MKKVYLETMGCQMNVSDSERVSTKLVSEGYEITEDAEKADVILFNTCSVREKAEQKLFTQVGRMRRKYGDGPVIGVMGCVAQLEGDTLFKRAPAIDFVLGTKAVGRVDGAIANAFGQRDGTIPSVRVSERHADPIFQTRISPKFAKYIDLDEREIDYDWSVAEGQRQSKYVAFVPIIEVRSTTKFRA